MIDSYYDSGVIDRDEVVKMLAELVMYYRRASSPSSMANFRQE